MKIQLDWKAYFEGFCEQHGKPVNHGGRLLFPDGWTYSRTDHKGPEWPPPTDPTRLEELRQAYWKARLEKAEQDWESVNRVYQNLSEMSRNRSVSLKIGVRVFDEETNGYRRGVSDVDLDAIEDEVLMLKEEVEECKTHLKMTSVRSRWSGEGSLTRRSFR